MPARLLTILTLLLASGVPVGAAETTTLEVGSVTPSGGLLAIAGSIAYGEDATGPITVAEDPAGDATTPGVGLDFGTVTIAADPVARRLTYGIQVHDMPPVAEQTSPAAGYTAPIMVDGNDTGAFLAAGNVGASFPPATGTFFQLCSAPEGSYTCDVPLSGTMDAGGITVALPYSRAAIQPGSLVEPGGAVGCGGSGMCTTLWAVLLFNNNIDAGFVSGYRVPGKVTVGIAPAGTPPDTVTPSVETTTGTDGAWTASISAPAPGDYVAVARTCWGSVDEPRCAVGTTDFTV